MATEKQRAYRAYLRSYKKRQKNNQYQREYYKEKNKSEPMRKKGIASSGRLSPPLWSPARFGISRKLNSWRVGVGLRLTSAARPPFASNLAARFGPTEARVGST